MLVGWTFNVGRWTMDVRTFGCWFGRWTWDSGRSDVGHWMFDVGRADSGRSDVGRCKLDVGRVTLDGWTLHATRLVFDVEILDIGR